MKTCRLQLHQYEETKKCCPFCVQLRLEKDKSEPNYKADQAAYQKIQDEAPKRKAAKKARKMTDEYKAYRKSYKQKLRLKANAAKAEERKRETYKLHSYEFLRSLVS